jgi:hypothetical protein
VDTRKKWKREQKKEKKEKSGDRNVLVNKKRETRGRKMGTVVFFMHINI